MAKKKVTAPRKKGTRKPAKKSVAKKKTGKKSAAKASKPTKKAAKEKPSRAKRVQRPRRKTAMLLPEVTSSALVPAQLESMEERGCCAITFVGTTFYEQTTRRNCEKKPENYPGATVVFHPNQPCPADGQHAFEMDEIDNLD